MKKLLTVSAMALLAVSAFGQGQVAFNNLDKTHNILAIVYNSDGTTALSGTAAKAALLGGPATGGVAYNAQTGVAGNLTQLASPVTGTTWVNFRTGAAAGYVAVGSDSPRILNNVGYNSQAMLQMVAWTGSANDWASAWAAHQTDPSVQIGTSNPWTVTTTLSAIDTAFAVNTGLSSFKLTAVPEPSTMALAGLAGAALLIFRRRK